MLSYSIGLTAGSGMSYVLDAILGPHISIRCEDLMTMAEFSDYSVNSTYVNSTFT